MGWWKAYEVFWFWTKGRSVLVQYTTLWFKCQFQKLVKGLEMSVWKSCWTPSGLPSSLVCVSRLAELEAGGWQSPNADFGPAVFVLALKCSGEELLLAPNFPAHTSLWLEGRPLLCSSESALTCTLCFSICLAWGRAFIVFLPRIYPVLWQAGAANVRSTLRAVAPGKSEHSQPFKVENGSSPQ